MNEPTIVDHKPVVIDLEPGTYYWCACGRSGKQPFCDGAHKGTGIEHVEFKITESTKKALCLCKHTEHAPFCDGSHSKV